MSENNPYHDPATVARAEQIHQHFHFHLLEAVKDWREIRETLIAEGISELDMFGRLGMYLEFIRQLPYKGAIALLTEAITILAKLSPEALEELDPLKDFEL